MTRNTKTILSEMKDLVNELETAMSGESSTHKKSSSKRSSAVAVPKGVLGTITMLLDEGFLDTPKELAQIMEKLKQIGHYHKKPAIAMNLLNLTKRRVLNRFKNKDTKNWEYVIRK